MIAALVKLDERQMLERFLREVAIATYDGSENAALLTTIEVLGDKKAALYTFDGRMEQYRDEIAAMRRLVKLAAKAGIAVLAERMKVAVKRAGEIQDCD